MRRAPNHSFCFDNWGEREWHFCESNGAPSHVMMAKKYNVGIIGYGWVSTAHIAAINATPHAQVAAVYSSRKLDSAELSARHGGAITAYNDLDAMLHDRGIHVVSICSYPQDHTKHAVAAAQAG